MSKRRSKANKKSVAPPSASKSGNRRSNRPGPASVASVAPKAEARSVEAVDTNPVAAPAESAPSLREDEISVPPAVLADLDDAFFASASRPPPPGRVPNELDVAARDLRMEQLTSPAAHARRAELAKYVKGVVAVSLAVCFLAFIRLAVQRNHAGENNAMAATEAPRPAVAAAAVAPPPADPTSIPAPAQPADSPAVVGAQPTEVAPAAEPPKPADAPIEPKVADKPSDAPSAPPAETAAAVPVEPDPAAAKIEKRKSQNALERGANAEAIDHGELSVKLDPTDGEAWLILGAAYQAKGSWLDARRCYKSCLSEGKRGPRGECSAMLR